MKITKALLLLSIILFFAPKEISASDGFLIHLSSNDPHRVSMALTFALKMSANHDVFVYVDVAGVEAVVKGSESIRFKDFEATRTIIDKLVKAGVKISVCKMCLEALGHSQYDLIGGLKIIEESDFNFTPGRIISLDY